MEKELLIDIGGTAVKYELANDAGTLEKGLFAVCDETGEECILARLIELVKKQQPKKIGISSPGPFDFRTGTAYMKHKLRSIYGISLRDECEKAAAGVQVMFIHDASAYMLGVMEAKPVMKIGTHCAVMIGTGLGYICAKDGRVMVDEAETPAGKLWNQPYKDSIGETYVSATALLRIAGEKGYSFLGVKEMADAAREGNSTLSQVFYSVGKDLGFLLNVRRQTDKFETVAIGGQVSQAFDLMREGFQSVSDIFLVTSIDGPMALAIYTVAIVFNNMCCRRVIRFIPQKVTNPSPISNSWKTISRPLVIM